ncbi:hypothetical protein NQ318_000779 [Aromia moschata]|uniref:U1-type domain-containing protein n=1 Tax=Aromia moschata TaxID=1265417 RepID=A0AAV8YV58_9CUCU|nr:hypothetical protein NQ318_000779 [Aromia moschata]
MSSVEEVYNSGVQDVDITLTNNNRLYGNEDIQSSDVTKKTPLSCEICNIKVTSTKILQRHLDGRKHKIRMERRGKSFTCELCEITANSETQLNIHLNSK